MPSKRVLQLAGMLLMVGAFSGYALAQEKAAPLTFSAAQVAGGRANFAAKCSKCHGPDLEGGVGPPLTDGALDNYLAQPVGVLFDFLNASMPQDAPGTLSPDETATLIAYLSSKNGRAPGGGPLPTDKAVLAKMSFDQ